MEKKLETTVRSAFLGGVGSTFGILQVFGLKSRLLRREDLVQSFQ